MSNAPDFKNLEQAFRGIARRAPRVVGGMAVTFFKGNFQRQGWTTLNRIDPWQKRSRQDKGKKSRAILILTGKLRRSIRVIAVGNMHALVGTDLPYAKIHNEGGKIKATQSIPQHSRRAFKRRVEGRKKLQQVSASNVKAHARKVNINMPRRRFIGPSLDVMKQAHEWIVKEIDMAVKNWK